MFHATIAHNMYLYIKDLKKDCQVEKFGAIALSYPPPPIVIDDSPWKNAAESFTVALTLTLGG